jgi:hypothetical protein
MKKITLILLLVSLLNITFSQETKTAKQYDYEINQAVENGNYELAAKLKKEKSNIVKVKSVDEYNLEIKTAIKNENYEKAAKLKKEKTILLEIEEAVKNGDYELAASLKKQLGGNSSKINSSGTGNGYNPEFTNQVYYQNIRTGELESLDKEKGEIKSKVSAAPFYASSTSYYYIQGNYSSKQLSSDASFIVQTTSGLDPEEYFKLTVLDPDKNGNDRYMPYHKYSGSVYGGESEKTNENDIELVFKRVEGDVFQLTPKNNLKDGEYGFMYINKFYCFRIGDIGNEEKEEVKERTNVKDNVLFKKSFILGWSLGTGSLLGTGASINMRIGTKWVFGNGPVYRPGIQAIWAKLGIVYGPSFNDPVLQVAFLNVGFSNTIAFNDKIGVEVNVNVGPSVQGTPDIIGFGVTFNPEFLFRYKKLYVGYNLEIASSFALYSSLLVINGVGLGFKF